jgi:hypothetical protein
MTVNSANADDHNYSQKHPSSAGSVVGGGFFSQTLALTPLPSVLLGENTNERTNEEQLSSKKVMALRGVWQLQKLIVSYCDWGGSSRGIRYAILSQSFHIYLLFVLEKFIS